MGGHHSQKLLPWRGIDSSPGRKPPAHSGINTLTGNCGWGLEGRCPLASLSLAWLQPAWVILGKQRWVISPARRRKLPNTDSIEELARFWDTHDLTDFQEDLEEVGEPVFVRTKGTSLSIDLQPAEAQHLKKIAQAKGVKETSVVRQWIVQSLQQSQGTEGAA